MGGAARHPGPLFCTACASTESKQRNLAPNRCRIYFPRSSHSPDIRPPKIVSRELRLNTALINIAAMQRVISSPIPRSWISLFYILTSEDGLGSSGKEGFIGRREAFDEQGLGSSSRRPGHDHLGHGDPAGADWVRPISV